MNEMLEEITAVIALAFAGTIIIHSIWVAL